MISDMIAGFGAFRRSIKPTEANYPSYEIMIEELHNVVDDPKRSDIDKEKARNLITEFSKKCK
jgi:hypothetical protein